MTRNEYSTPATAGNGRRLAARVIDLFLAGVLTIALLLVALLAALSGLECAGSWVVACGVKSGAAIAAVALFVLGLCFPLVYELLCVAFWARTPGKAIVGLSITTAGGARAGWGKALLRASAVWLLPTAALLVTISGAGSDTAGALFFLLSIAWPIVLAISLFAGRSLADRIAGTSVVRGPPPPAAAPVFTGTARKIVLGGAAVLVLLIAIVVLKPIGDTGSGKLEVLTTTALLADLVEGVGGDRIDLAHAYTSAAEVHRVDPTRKQRNAVRSAAVVISFGGIDADFTLRTGADAGYRIERSRTDASLTIERLNSAYERAYPDRLLSGRFDNHTWLSVPNALKMVANIRDALSASDPENAGVFEGNAGRYMDLLDGLDTDIRAEVARVPERCRNLVTDREFLTYYAAAYGFNVIGPAVSPFGNQEQEARVDREAIAAKMRALGVKTIFVHQGATAEVQPVASATGARVVELYVDELGGPGSGAETYVDLMRTNTSLIVEALRGC